MHRLYKQAFRTPNNSTYDPKRLATLSKRLFSSSNPNNFPKPHEQATLLSKIRRDLEEVQTNGNLNMVWLSDYISYLKKNSGFGRFNRRKKKKPSKKFNEEKKTSENGEEKEAGAGDSSNSEKKSENDKDGDKNLTPEQ